MSLSECLGDSSEKVRHFIIRLDFCDVTFVQINWLFTVNGWFVIKGSLSHCDDFCYIEYNANLQLVYPYLMVSYN